MPETSDQALEVQAADVGRSTGRQNQLQPWVCCGSALLCWALVWQRQGSLGFKPQAAQREEESTQANA